ncbi:MAG: DNA gyrase C-terminal beta-propeller domain-containing protein, partial [Oscillospiraceae bacterium]
SGIRDESNRLGIKVVIELKRDANAQVVLNQLYSYSSMQQTFGVIMLALVDGQPKVLTLKQMLEEYIKFQEEIIRKRTEFDLKKANARAHILDGLKRATDVIDEIIETIRACKGGQSEAKQAIMDAFDFDDIQAAAIVAFRLGQLAGLEILKIETELAELMEKINEYNYILSHEEKIKEIILEELTEINDKYKDERRTSIETVTGEVDIEDLIPVEDCVLTLTHYGYVKRQCVDVYKTQHRGGRGISGMTRREEDFVENLFVCSTHDYIMFFTNKGKVYRIKGYEIPECSRAARGTNIVNILPLEKEEKITSVIKVADIDELDKNLVMVTKNGIIKRTALEEYKNVRKGGLIAINLDDDDELSWVKLTNGGDKLIVATRNGMSIAFDENDARLIGRTARGVKAITLDEGDTVVGMCTAEENAQLLTVSETGLGRRTSFDEYRIQSRGGKGTRNYYVDKNGFVAGIRCVKDDEDVIIITDDGVIIRIPADQISVQSRYAGGVKVMKIADESKVVTLAVAAKEDVEEDEQQEVVGEVSNNSEARPETETINQQENQDEE